MDHPHLQKVLLENRPFRVGHYISKGFEIFGKNLGSFVAFSLLSVLIMSFVGSVPWVGAWASKFAMVPVLTAGIYLVAHEVNKGNTVEFGDHFMGFQHLVRLALAAMAISVITTAATVPFFIANKGLLEWTWSLTEFSASVSFDSVDDFVAAYPGFHSWKFLLLLPMIYLAVAYSWTRMFVVFYDLNVWEAMEASRKLISKNWLTYLLFSITLAVIGLGGLFGLFIGVFFTYPAMLCINYAAFEDITQLKKSEREEKYVDILVK